MTIKSQRGGGQSSDIIQDSAIKIGGTRLGPLYEDEDWKEDFSRYSSNDKKPKASIDALATCRGEKYRFIKLTQ